MILILNGVMHSVEFEISKEGDPENIQINGQKFSEDEKDLFIEASEKIKESLTKN